MYKIKLNDVVFHSHIGVFPAEKEVGQKLALDVIVETNFDFDGRDEIDATLSYADFYTVCQQVVTSSQANLVEKIAYDIIQGIKALAPSQIAAVEVHARKYNLPLDAELSSAEIEMRG